MFVLEVQSSVDFSFSFGKKQNIIEHVTFINNNLIFWKFAYLWNWWHYSYHKTTLILRYGNKYFKERMSCKKTIEMKYIFSKISTLVKCLFFYCNEVAVLISHNSSSPWHIVY
jgi:hypothetical protein